MCILQLAICSPATAEALSPKAVAAPTPGDTGVSPVSAPTPGGTGVSPVTAPDPPSSTASRTVLIVIGAPGTPEYGRMFAEWAGRWQSAARRGGADVIVVGRDNERAETDRSQLRHALKTIQSPRAAPRGMSELWLVLIGHGTFDGREAKFNLRGPDLSASEFAQWLSPLACPTAVINCASSSGPFIDRLAAEDRVVITATKSGSEHNFARFGGYLSQVVGDSEADLDKDGQTSLLEAWLTASRRVETYYKDQGQLATEHALLDDNGDGRGTPADWFRGIRPVEKSADGAGVDGYHAHQWHLIRSEREADWPPELRQRRDELELKVIRLRERKDRLPEDEYYRELKKRLLPLARLYEEAEEN